MQKKSLSLLILLQLLLTLLLQNGCGVKAPPVPPQRKPEARLQDDESNLSGVHRTFPKFPPAPSASPSPTPESSKANE